MSSWLLRLAVALLVAALMDLWAMLLHGRVWHTLLWSVHRSHHRKRAGRFEHNDALSALHAPIAITAIVIASGAESGLVTDLIFGAGVGMSLFGVAYFVVHDGLVHGRLPVQALGKVGYLARVRAAHLVHHGKGRGGPPYGLFFGPWELRRAQARAAVSTTPDANDSGRATSKRSVDRAHHHEVESDHATSDSSVDHAHRDAASPRSRPTPHLPTARGPNEVITSQ